MRDHIDQNQANFAGTDYAHTTRDTLDVQLDLAARGSHSISLGAQYNEENTDALSFGTGFDEQTAVFQGFVQDQFTP